MKTPTAEQLILNITRVIRAPRPRVFAAFTTMDEIKKWLGSDKCSVVAGQMDFRKGGRYTYKSNNHDMGPSDITGAYQEIVPNELIRFTWAVKNNPQTEGWGEMLVTVRFADHSEGTQISLTHEGFIDEQVRDGHNQGWNDSFRKLEATLNAGAKAPDTSPGVFCWNELVTHDAAASTKFYSALFGWNTEVKELGGGMKYTMFKQGESREAGMFQLPSDAADVTTAWIAYVTVPDLTAATEKAKSLGAHICKDHVPVPGMGRFSIITDPQGAVLGLWEFARQ
jgi:predicted enzyme related to lactoylglutathione lyase/uncharacterized protein YndB with AHSA1/START domain